MVTVVQGSPSTFTPTDRESYRRGSSVTSWRAGKDGKPYLYTLNLACPEERWAELGGLYHKAADSFKLTPPTKVSGWNWLARETTHSSNYGRLATVPPQ